MTVEDFYNLVFFILDANAGQGNVTRDEFNNVANRAQYSYQNYLIGEIQQYQYGRPIARVDYSQNRKIRQRLTPSIYNYILNVTSGLSPFPGDYILADAMLTTDNKIIRYIPQNKLANYLDSEIDPIASNYGYVMAEDGFTFYPDTIAQAKLAYVRTAPPIVYATSIDGNGREIYDAANSVDPIWGEMDCLEIVVRALAIMGVPLQLQQVQSYAQNIKTNGQ